MTRDVAGAHVHAQQTGVGGLHLAAEIRCGSETEHHIAQARENRSICKDGL